MSFNEVPDYDPTISSRSRNGNTTNMAAKPKDIIKRRTTNIQRTGVTNYIWDIKQKSISTHKTNKPKSTVTSNIWHNKQKPKSTNNVSTTATITANINNIYITAQNMGKIDTQKLASLYRAKVLNAYNNQRIFSIHRGYYMIRKSLCDRGWLEKLGPGLFPNISYFSDEDLLKNSRPGNDYERVYLNRLLYKYPAFFVWQPRYFRDLYHHAMPIRCYIKRSTNLDFTNKIGITGCTKHSLKLSNLCVMNYPRCYSLNNTEERKEFIEDYRRTQCRNLVRFVIENISTPHKLADIEKGTILIAPTLTYAIEYMIGTLYNKKSLALDLENKSEENKLNYNNWRYFVHCCESIIHGGSKFKASVETIKEFATITKEYLDIIDGIRPTYKWDGVRNIWILKPAKACQGFGIVVRHSLHHILRWATKHHASNYIVQKYIERPLLIYNTKFDVRQYMIISIGNTDATIWLYKDCYLKFSSQVFSLDNLSESIHLTNNTVQVHYPIDKNRDRRLPAHNMWSLEEFLNYLKWKDAPADVWSKKIFAGFKENLIGVVLASFEGTKFEPNTFELYGCDFMLDRNYNPILIEINHSPAMYASTPVTARLCPMVLCDLIKVVIDVPKNSNAPTGLFELVHSINYKNLNGIGKAMAIQRDNTSSNAMAVAQESFNTSGKAITVSQVNTSDNAMAVPQKSSSTIGLATTVSEVNDSGSAMTIVQEILNTVLEAVIYRLVNTSENYMKEPQKSLNSIGESITVSQVNTSGNAITVSQESLCIIGLAITVSKVNTSSSAMTIPQEILNTVLEAVIDRQVNTSGNDMIVPQESLNTIGKATTDPQVNPGCNAITVSEDTISKVMTDPQVNTSGNAKAVPQTTLNNSGEKVKIHQPTLTDLKIQHQRAKVKKKENSKEPHYQKLFAKRRQLTKFLTSLNN